MAAVITDQSLYRRPRYGSFGTRYPDFVGWLDGQTWELDVEAEIEPHETVGNFRSSMHYQARQFGLRLLSRNYTRDGRRYFAVQAVPRDPEPADQPAAQ